MTYAERMRQKLTEGLSPERLDIIDESHKHAGHGGAHPEGETHFRIDIVASAFEGLNPVNRQRKVYELVAEELKERVHALALSTKTPGEAS